MASRTKITLHFLGNQQTLKGYVHLLTEVSTASNGKTKYFNFQMQTSANEAVKLVCFSPEKRLDIKHSQDKRAPLQISQATRSPKRLGSSTDEYTIREVKLCQPS